MEAGDFAIAPLPSTRQKAKYFMYYQTIHGKRTVGGCVSRTPREATRFMEEHELIWSLCTTRAVDSEITDISREMFEAGTLRQIGAEQVCLGLDYENSKHIMEWINGR